MSKRTWYLIGLVLLAAACNPVFEPKSELFKPGLSADTAQTGNQQHRKLDP